MIYPSLLIESGILAGDSALAALRGTGRPGAEAGKHSILALFDRLGARERNTLRAALEHNAPA